MDRILVNAVIHPSALERIEEAGYESFVVREQNPEASLEAAPGCVAIVSNASLRLDEEFFGRAPRLQVVGRVGVGYDNVDVDAARRHGVRVVNTPLPVIEPVAEHAFALILGLTRRVIQGDRDVRDGLFREKGNLPGMELAGKTLGIVGMGNTGRRVAEIGRWGFHMEIVYFDLRARPDVEESLGARQTELDELLRASDFVSLHVNLSPSTRHLLDAKALGAMKPGAYLINVSRGPVVDEAALLEALRAGRLAGAGLDVYEREPPGRDNPLLELPNTLLSPHRGGFSVESFEGCSAVVDDVLRVLRGEDPLFPVN